jgi:methylenetetrahydrofolate dehydrogenase (NADP+) / methenyltetrahydrofolate cyclohydrolase
VRLSGKDIAEKVYQTLHGRVEKLQLQHITPHLVVFLIGENPASVAYVKQKQLKGQEIGCLVTVINLPESVTTQLLEDRVRELNDDPKVHGILIQRPVPDHVDIDKLELLTSPEKDIDGFHPNSPYTFPIPMAVMKILEEVYQFQTEDGVARLGDPHRAPATNVRTSDGGKERQDPIENEFAIWLQNQKIVIIGKGPTGGGPIIKEFAKRSINHTIIDSRTPNREVLLKNADIIISAVGRENIITAQELKQGVILIGVGILRGADGKLHGDYNEEEIDPIAGYYTTTPGGVGPVNVAMLFENVLTAAEQQVNK